MSGSFSLVEKLAVAGAFCAIVAMGVGTEEEPGVVAVSQEAVAKARPAQDAAPAATTTSQRGGGWWFVPGGGRDAAAEDERGSIGVEKAPEPPPQAL